MATLINILYYTTSVLLAPVIVVLLGLLAWCLFDAGWFLREWVKRLFRRNNLKLCFADGKIKATPEDTRVEIPCTALSSGLVSKPNRMEVDTENIDRVFSIMELNAHRICSRSTTCGRSAQVLGLMGTLIPMGPALIGLSSGNIDQMATNLVVAFSTTVVGLLTNVLCMVITSKRRLWYAGDLSGIECEIERIADERRNKL